MASQALLKSVTSARYTQTRLLLGLGADVNVRDAHGQTPVIRALRLRDGRLRTGLLRLLLKAGALVSLADHHGDNALMWACKQGGAHEVALLLKLADLDLDLNAQNGLGQTALWLAVRGDRADVVRDLLAQLHSQGLGPEVADHTGVTPAHLAARLGHLDCLKVMVSHVKGSARCHSTLVTMNHITNVVDHQTLVAISTARKAGGEQGTVPDPNTDNTSAQLPSIRIISANGKSVTLTHQTDTSNPPQTSSTRGIPALPHSTMAPPLTHPPPRPTMAPTLTHPPPRPTMAPPLSHPPPRPTMAPPLTHPPPRPTMAPTLTHPPPRPTMAPTLTQPVARTSTPKNSLPSDHGVSSPCHILPKFPTSSNREESLQIPFLYRRGMTSVTDGDDTELEEDGVSEISRDQKRSLSFSDLSLDPPRNASTQTVIFPPVARAAVVSGSMRDSLPALLDLFAQQATESYRKSAAPPAIPELKKHKSATSSWTKLRGVAMLTGLSKMAAASSGKTSGGSGATSREEKAPVSGMVRLLMAKRKASGLAK